MKRTAELASREGRKIRRDGSRQRAEIGKEFWQRAETEDPKEGSDDVPSIFIWFPTVKITIECPRGPASSVFAN
jgi:hypothetical protein